MTGSRKHGLELSELLAGSVPQLVNFLQNADQAREADVDCHLNDIVSRGTFLVHPESTSRSVLDTKLRSGKFLDLQEEGAASAGVQETLKTLLEYSVNTSAPGFLDKLYAAPLPPGIVAELVLSVLNTNVHVYQVSPVLTLVERRITRQLADMFGLRGPHRGGISVQGGSASNMTSIVIARNALFPDTKTRGNSAVEGKLVILTSKHGHYSIEKAAQAIGLGSDSVVLVPVDEVGRMIPSELERLVVEQKTMGRIPFYVNSTAGSTVLGSFDAFGEIAAVARQHRLWFHIDAAWGGGFIFSERSDLQQRLKGAGLADSIATNPHKMLGVPVTCSFLLGNNLKQFQEANTLKAGYLFHEEDDTFEPAQQRNEADMEMNGVNVDGPTLVNGSIDDSWEVPYDIADLTLQCGRRGDSLKLFFCWKYYGRKGYSQMIDAAYEVACTTCRLVDQHPDLQLVLAGTFEPSCLQICFYFTPRGKFAYGLRGQPSFLGDGGHAKQEYDEPGPRNSSVTSRIAKALITKGFMVDFAPALEGQEDRGSFFRVVVNISTIQPTIDRLLKELVDAGFGVMQSLQ